MSAPLTSSAATSPAVAWRSVTVAYDGGAVPVLQDVRLEIPEGELVVVAGRTGSGKSTLLGTVNGLVPRFTGGVLGGEVLVGGQSTVGLAPRELAHLVGYVGQDPSASFVTDRVEDELAYGMEQLGSDPQTMRRRVEETLDLLGIADLRDRPLRALSGGQQQRVAIGAVLTMHPRLLVLDEPTSALDPVAAEDVLGILARLVADVGLTILLAEHRLERVVPFVDQVVVVERGRVRSGDPAEVLLDSPVAPPLVELGRVAGWRPLPLTVRDARRRTASLSLGHPPAARPRAAMTTSAATTSAAAAATPAGTGAEPALVARDLVVTHGRTPAVREASLEVAAGSVVALMGRNGSGKSSLLWAVQGSGPRQSGTVRVAGTDPARVPAAQARRLVGLVPQTAADLLYLETVAEECAAADAQAGAPRGTCRGLLDRMVPGVDPGRHPRDLSEGQRLALVLALVLTAGPRVLALDEPTRGLDYAAKEALAGILGDLATTGCGILVATHDVEFAARVAAEVVVLAAGEVVSAGPVARVLTESPAFAPQLAKVLGPGWLTLAQVREALSARVEAATT